MYINYYLYIYIYIMYKRKTNLLSLYNRQNNQDMISLTIYTTSLVIIISILSGILGNIKNKRKY